MRRWRGILICVCLLAALSAAGVYVLSGDGPYQDAQPNASIIYIYKTGVGTSEFWRSVTDGVRAGSREFGYDYHILGATEEADIAGNIAAVEKAIEMAPDVIVLSAAGYYDLEPAAGQVVDAGILLLTLDSDVSGDWAKCYIGSDNRQVGWQLGEELKGRLDGQGKILIVGHVAGTKSTEDRIQGAMESLAELGEERILPPVYCNNHASLARQQTTALLEAHPDIHGIIATNEDSALGVAEAVAGLGMQERVHVVTCDNSSGQISYLEQGVIDATIAQRPFNMGYFSVQLADRILREKSAQGIPEFYDTGSEVITVDNYLTVENQKLLFPFR